MTRRHDPGTKVIMGQTIAGGGEREIEQVLDILSRHPSTARHISYKLAQYFVADTPPEPLVKKMAATFTRTDGQIAAVLNTLFESEEFWNPQNRNNKFRVALSLCCLQLEGDRCHHCRRSACSRLSETGRATALQMPDSQWIQEHTRGMAKSRQPDQPPQLRHRPWCQSFARS